MGLFIKTDVLITKDRWCWINVVSSTLNAHVTCYKTSQLTITISCRHKYKCFYFPFVRGMILGRAASLMALVLVSLFWHGLFLPERPKQDSSGSHHFDQPSDSGLHIHRPGQRAGPHRQHQLHAHLQLRRLLLLQRGHDLQAADQRRKGRPRRSQGEPNQVEEAELQAFDRGHSPKLREPGQQFAPKWNFVRVRQGHGPDLSPCIKFWCGKDVLPHATDGHKNKCVHQAEANGQLQVGPQQQHILGRETARTELITHGGGDAVWRWAFSYCCRRATEQKFRTVQCWQKCCKWVSTTIY